MVVLNAPFAVAKEKERKFTQLERELEYLIQIWPGDFDNQEQVKFESGVRIASELMEVLA